MTGNLYTFYMRGGHAIQTENVSKLTMDRANDGSYNGYNIEWVAGKAQVLFSLNPNDIVAVVCTRLAPSP